VPTRHEMTIRNRTIRTVFTLPASPRRQRQGAAAASRMPRQPTLTRRPTVRGYERQTRFQGMAGRQHALRSVDGTARMDDLTV
jgi:hypothetical protein